MNLLPLILLRPLRLFVSSDSIRSARIVLLKATHLPIVAAIWLFESAKYRVSGSASTFSPTGPTTTNSRSKRPFFANLDSLKSRPNEHAPSRQVSASKTSKQAEAYEPSNQTSVGLEAKVADLSQKIEELSRIILQQQQQQQSAARDT